MKSLRYSLVLIFLLQLSFSSYTQNFGLKAGYSLSDMLVKEENENISDQLSARSGFHIGPSIEFQVKNNFYIETALLFTTKGISASEPETFEDVTYSTEAELHPLYLDIPLYAKTYVEIEEIKLYGMFGPYFGIGLAGKIKIDEVVGTEFYSEEDDISWGSGDDDDLKRLSAGLALGGGMQVSSFLFELSAHMGLSNVSPQSEYDVTAKNRLFMITVGYKFGR